MFHLWAKFHGFILLPSPRILRALLPAFPSLSDSMSLTKIATNWAWFQGVFCHLPEEVVVSTELGFLALTLMTRFFPVYTTVSPTWREWSLSTFLTSLRRATCSMLPLCGALASSSLIVCPYISPYFLRHTVGVGIMLVEVKREWQILDHVDRENWWRPAANWYGIWLWQYWIFRTILAPFEKKKVSLS